MENFNREHEQINTTKRHLQIAWWILSIFIAVISLVGFIIITVDLFQPIIDVIKAEGLSARSIQGYVALIFFALLFFTAISIYLLYILKEYLFSKLNCCKDVKYLREEIKEINKNNKPSDNNQNIEKLRKADSNDLCAIANIEYHLWSKSCLAYVVYVAEQNGENRQITFSRDEHKSLTFKSREDALEYAVKNKLDTEKDFLII